MSARANWYDLSQSEKMVGRRWHALDFIVAAFPLADDREDVRSRLALLLFLQVAAAFFIFPTGDRPF